MNADLKGALANLNKAWSAFTHNGKPLSKEQVKALLQYGISKGYESTADLTDPEIDHVLETLKK
mgnify:CR=1 FL=1